MDNNTSLSEYSKEPDRTTDVQTLKETPFSAFVANPKILNGLSDSGFTIASPIQVTALPTVITGNDTVIEAKNGTGKTLTFVIPTLMKLKLEQSSLQSIILTPTREIAFQIQQCFNQVGRHLSELKCEYFIGGTSVELDKEKANGCQIAVGTPGRIKHMLNDHVLNGSEVKTFIIDEVDRLFTDVKFLKDVRWIDAKLPKFKQIIFASASLDKDTVHIFDEFMNEYSVVSGTSGSMNQSEDPAKFLIGIKQYVACVKAVSANIILLPAKNLRLLNILQNISYTQCIVFTNYMTRAQTICNVLRDHNYKADYIRGDQDQKIRLKLVDRLMSFQSKVLVATDLVARGINSSNVDLVINMDCPTDAATYLHRIGRAGRFGNKASAVTILDDGKELKSFKQIINSIEYIKIKTIPIAISKPIYEYTDEEMEILDLTTEPDVVLEKSDSESDVNDVPLCDDNIVLTTEFDVPKEYQNGNNATDEISNNITDENKIEIHGKNNFEGVATVSESNFNKKPLNVDISEEESLENLRKFVKETEKKLIDENQINEKFLTTDRTFVLFNPETYLDDTAQYENYHDVVNLVTDLFELDPLKKEVNAIDISAPSEQNKCLKKNTHDSTDKKISETNDISNESNSSDYTDMESDSSISETPRNTNVIDLFKLHNFKVLLPQNTDECGQKHIKNCSEEVFNVNRKKDEQEDLLEEYREEFDTKMDKSSDEDIESEDYDEDSEIENYDEDSESENLDEDNKSENSDEDNVSGYSEYENEVIECEHLDEGNESKHNKDSESENSNEDNESENSNEDSKSENLDEDSKSENLAEDNISGYMNKFTECKNCNKYLKYEHFDEDNENKNFNEGIKKQTKNSIKILNCNNTHINSVTPQLVVNEIETDESQYVDYNILNDWYNEWKQQMNFIQTCVKLSR